MLTDCVPPVFRDQKELQLAIIGNRLKRKQPPLRQPGKQGGGKKRKAGKKPQAKLAAVSSQASMNTMKNFMVALMLACEESAAGKK